MHGAGGSADTYIGTESNPTDLKNIIDNMINKKRITPLIIVTPEIESRSDYYESSSKDNYKELLNDLIPAVEGKYHTYAKSTSLNDLKTSRNHRVFGGFSIGGTTTWYTFIHDLDYFEYFLPMSGNYWAITKMGGTYSPDKTAEYLNNIALKSGYSKDKYYIFAATGTDDVAYQNLSGQINSMKKYTKAFTYTTNNFSSGNLIFYVVDGNIHDYSYTYRYIYNALPLFFKKS